MVGTEYIHDWNMQQDTDNNLSIVLDIVKHNQGEDVDEREEEADAV
jgi:hypothetical protein